MQERNHDIVQIIARNERKKVSYNKRWTDKPEPIIKTVVNTKHMQ